MCVGHESIILFACSPCSQTNAPVLRASTKDNLKTKKIKDKNQRTKTSRQPRASPFRKKQRKKIVQQPALSLIFIELSGSLAREVFEKVAEERLFGVRGFGERIRAVIWHQLRQDLYRLSQIHGLSSLIRHCSISESGYRANECSNRVSLWRYKATNVR